MNVQIASHKEGKVVYKFTGCSHAVLLTVVTVVSIAPPKNAQTKTTDLHECACVFCLLGISNDHFVRVY